MDFKLTTGDRINPLWARIEEELNRLLKIECTRLEKDAPEYDTAKVRGKIAAYRKVLGFAIDDPKTMMTEAQ